MILSDNKDSTNNTIKWGKLKKDEKKLNYNTCAEWSPSQV